MLSVPMLLARVLSAKVFCTLVMAGIAPFNIVSPSRAQVPRSSTFSDTSNHWANSCIEGLGTESLMKGYLDGSFRPNSTLTRTEFAAMMLKAFPDAEKVRDTPNFSDVIQDFWGRGAITAAYERGFLAGYPDNTFKPNQNITRAQAITVIARAHRLQSPNNSQAIIERYFDDAGEIPAYARAAIAAATQRSLVVNYPTVTRLAPNEDARRGEAAALLCRLDAAGVDARYYVPAEYVAGFEDRTNHAVLIAPTLLKEFPIPSASGLLFSNTIFDQKVFFSANDGIHGEELWMTDGTVTGTQLVHDLAPGNDENGQPQSSVPSIFGFSDQQFWLTTLQRYEQSTFAQSLWRSDGTAAGTRAITTLNPELPNLFNQARNIIALTDIFPPARLPSFAFFIESVTAPLQLWITDGVSEAGTRHLADFPMTDIGTRYEQSVAFTNEHFFFAIRKDTEDFAPLWQLWRSDGTAEGTIDLETPNVDSNAMKAWGDRIYMTAYPPNEGAQWWTSDGSPAGTGLLQDIYPGAEQSPPHLLTGLEDSFFALAQSPTGFGLWATEGTPESTRLVKQLSAGPAYSSPRETQFIAHQGRLFFATPIVRQTLQPDTEPLSRDTVELWVTDGTEQGTQQLGNFPTAIESFATFQGKLFFSGSGPNGHALWVTDGTAQGTRKVLDIEPAGGPTPRALTAHGNFLYFIADNRHLYRTDGTGQGMQYVQRIKGDSYNCCSPQIVPLGDSLLFSAYTPEGDLPQLWTLTPEAP